MCSFKNGSYSILLCLFAERKVAVEAAVQEAKAASKARQDAASVQSEAEKEGKYTSAQLLSKFFKRPSAQAKKLGEAQLVYELMVRKAERKLAENRRRSLASSQDAKEKAEVIAQELFHKPGTLLTKDEIAHMWQESGCEELRPRPRCNFATINEFRTINGECNNRRNPLFGAAGTQFRRLTPAVYEDGISSLRGTLQARNDFLTIGPFVAPNPSARLISESIVQNVSQEELPFSHLLMQWGQFLDHDLDLSPELEAECVGCEATEVCEPIRVADRDRKFGVGTLNNGDCLPLRRSLPTCDLNLPLRFNAREQSNDITSYIDGSMVYGSREETAARIRAFEGGLLRTGPNFPGSKPTLPVDVDNIVACPNRMDCFLCGDVRCNEQISLTIIHTLWLREHNRCARELARINPHWEDERLYQECRAIVGALIQKITYSDYLPKVFGVPAFNLFVGPYPGYLPEVDASIPNSFATAAYRYGHSLIRPQFDRLDANYNPLSIGPLNLVDAFFNPDQFRLSLGTDPIVRGWSARNSQRMDEFLNSVLTSQLFQTPASPGMDLASLNIQRGRDHGLAPYPTWQNFCARVFGQFSDFENDLTLVRFLQLYGSLETLDLWVGGLAENRLPESLLGATFSCIFGLTFQAVRNGDRFWYERNIQFGRQQRNEIKKGTMARIICDNSDNIRSIQPDVYLTNQTRVSCDQIPSVNLEAWREKVCYYRIRVRPRNFDVLVNTFSRSIKSNFILTSAAVRSSTSDSFDCVQMQCPDATAPTDVMILTEELVDVSQDKSLPSSGASAPYVYRADWPRSQFDARLGGVFFTRPECEKSNQVALTFSGTRSASTTQAKGEKKEVPDEVLEILDSENPNAVVESYPSKTGEGVAKMASDEELLKELEDALHKLQ